MNKYACLMRRDDGSEKIAYVCAHDKEDAKCQFAEMRGMKPVQPDNVYSFDELDAVYNADGSLKHG